MKAILYLEDGSFFHGESFGATGEVSGEVVFNTSMTGYQEILTDPSYYGQMVTMTYPEIGNYGVNEEDVESARVQARGFIVKNYNEEYSNFRAEKSLGKYLEENKVIGICKIDTRALTKKIREVGSMNGIISTVDFELESLKIKVSQIPDMKGLNLVDKVTPKEKYSWSKLENEKKYKVAVYDYGIKYNILRILESLGCELNVYPASTNADEILATNPDGVFLSNGPGDPASVNYAAENIKKLIGKTPIFGICLGHQLLSIALGGETYKLKFGHRGANQPVQNLSNRKVEITSQNHGFSVTNENIKGVNIEFKNLNDDTVEGIFSEDKKLLSVQHHPEASPGPHDSFYIFKKFIGMMEMR